MDELVIQAVDISSPEIKELLLQLNAALTRITGRDGTMYFREADFQADRSVFLAALLGDTYVGCGGIRMMDIDTAEVKRLFAVPNQIGIGSKLLAQLEKHAARMGYTRIRLETSIKNEHALAFYRKNHYAVCENYGPYVGREDAVCYEKCLK